MHTLHDRKSPRWLIPFLGTALICGCQNSSAKQQSSSGVQVLEPVPLAHSAEGVEFSMITGVGVDSKGRIYAGDRLGEIIVLDERGELVRRFGRMGGGPGEYELVASVDLLEGDSLHVFDGIGLRATVYAPDSDRVAYTVRLPEPSYSYPMVVQPINGHLVAHFRRINGDLPITGQRRDDLIRILHRDGSILRDSVLTVREPEVAELRNEQSWGFYTPDFSRQTLLQ
jgi:hypothetical protein